jgi:hypothetical protein
MQIPHAIEPGLSGRGTWFTSLTISIFTLHSELQERSEISFVLGDCFSAMQTFALQSPNTFVLVATSSGVEGGPNAISKYFERDFSVILLSFIRYKSSSVFGGLAILITEPAKQPTSTYLRKSQHIDY